MTARPWTRRSIRPRSARRWYLSPSFAYSLLVNVLLLAVALVALLGG